MCALTVVVGVLVYVGCGEYAHQSQDSEHTPDAAIDFEMGERDASVNTPDAVIDFGMGEQDVSVNTLDALIDFGGREQDASTSTMHCDGLAGAFTQQTEPEGEPPFVGTLFVHAELIIDSDPTAFTDLSYAGVELRTMFDRRTAAFGEYLSLIHI